MILICVDYKGWSFSLEEALLLIMDYKDYGILARTVMVWSQNALMMDLFLTNTVFDYKIC